MDIRRYFRSYPPSPDLTADTTDTGDDRIVLDDSCWIRRGRLPRDIAFDFDRAWDHKPAERGTLVIHGNKVTIPRWTQSYIRPYYFSGKLHPAAPMPDVYVPVYDWACNVLHRETETCTAPDKPASTPSTSPPEFNQMLVNWYLNGNDYIGAHADAERDLRPRCPILSVSFGQERTFRVRRMATKTVVADLPMPDRTYIVMGGAMQERYTHEVPKINGQKGERAGRRINVTFRAFR